MRHSIFPNLIVGFLSGSVSLVVVAQTTDLEDPAVAPAAPGHSGATVTEDPASAGSDVPTTISVLAGTDPDPAAIRAATNFVFRATIDGMTEVELGRLALKRSQSDTIHQLAQRMIDDHEQADAALNVIATGKNISVPKEIGSDQQRLIETLAGKTGKAFDTAYLRHAILATIRETSLFTAAAGENDSEIAAFAYEALPSLKNQREMAESLKPT
jgi:putative membrane protein